MKLTKQYLKSLVKEVISEASSDMELQAIASIIKGKSLMGLRKDLENLYNKKDISFSFEPNSMFMIKSKKNRSKTIVITNKNNVDVGTGDLVVDNLVVGYLN